jgi:hypothetical protein
MDEVYKLPGGLRNLVILRFGDFVIVPAVKSQNREITKSQNYFLSAEVAY